MPVFFYLLITLLVGGLLPIQGAINTRLSRYLNHPLQSSLISFFIGTLFLLFLNIFIRKPVPGVHRILEIPPHLFLGGIIGAVFVSSVIFLIPNIGVTAFLATAVSGQMILSLIIDHFGFFNIPVRPVSPERIVGVGLLLLGVYLIQKN
jgi:transporter family-2 protein